jgi:hypothetical protein
VVCFPGLPVPILVIIFSSSEANRQSFYVSKEDGGCTTTLDISGYTVLCLTGPRLLTCHKTGHRREPPSICLSTMDIIHQCLSLAPVPGLVPAFAALRFIYSSVQQAQASKEQLVALTQSIAQLLHTLDRGFHAGRLFQAEMLTPLVDLRQYVKNILPLT